MALTLLRRDLDIWKPGEHNGTFRGNCHAFVTARAALERFWRSPEFEQSIRDKAAYLRSRLESLSKKFGSRAVRVKGRGMMLGIDVGSGATASAIVKKCFEEGLVIETSGPEDEIVKCLAPLTISREELEKGLDILTAATNDVLAHHLKATA
jgi:diaminobutyrate-2-oxoglutarate transaminase